MDWTHCNYMTGSTAGTPFYLDIDTITTNTTTSEFPDPLIDWLPYKIEKYIPAWHIMESYGPHDDLTNKERLDVLIGRGYFK